MNEQLVPGAGTRGLVEGAGKVGTWPLSFLPQRQGDPGGLTAAGELGGVQLCIECLRGPENLELGSGAVVSHAPAGGTVMRKLILGSWGLLNVHADRRNGDRRGCGSSR